MKKHGVRDCLQLHPHGPTLGTLRWKRGVRNAKRERNKVKRQLAETEKATCPTQYGKCQKEEIRKKRKPGIQVNSKENRTTH